MKKDFGSFEELAKYLKTKQRIEELSFAMSTTFDWHPSHNK
jgi:hypothetical protein